jgi:hypothetical protein
MSSKNRQNSHDRNVVRVVLLHKQLECMECVPRSAGGNGMGLCCPWGARTNCHLWRKKKSIHPNSCPGTAAYVGPPHCYHLNALLCNAIPADCHPAHLVAANAAGCPQTDGFWFNAPGACLHNLC